MKVAPGSDSHAGRDLVIDTHGFIQCTVTTELNLPLYFKVFNKRIPQIPKKTQYTKKYVFLYFSIQKS